MPGEKITNNLENQNDADFNSMSQLTKMPDFAQHLEQQSKIPELKYDTIEKVSQNFTQALIDMGLDESFAQNESLQRIIESAKFNFTKDAIITSALEAPASFKHDSIQTNFVQNQHNYQNSITVDNPNQFTIKTSERHDDNYKEIMGMTHDKNSTTYTLQKNGWLFVDGHDSTTSTFSDREHPLNREHDTFNSQTFTHRECNADGQEVRMEAKTYTGNYHHANAIYSDDSMLISPDFMQHADSTPTSILRLERTGKETMHVFIESDENNEHIKYSAEENINGEHGFQDLVLLNGRSRK